MADARSVSTVDSSRRHAPTRVGACPDERLVDALRVAGRLGRGELGTAAKLSERQTAEALGRLLESGHVVDRDGVWELAAAQPSPAARPRRSDAHARLRAMQRQRIAESFADLQPVRQSLLASGLLQESEVGEWLTQQSQSESAQRRHRLYYMVPDSTSDRWVWASPTLEPLRSLGQRIADHLSMPPSLVTVFILTGVFYNPEIRLSVNRRFGPGVPPARAKVEFDLDEDAEVIAARIREFQRQNGAGKRPKAADAERFATLAEFVREHGTGEQAWRRWRREHPEAGYSGRQSFNAAANKVAPRSPLSAFAAAFPDHHG